MYLDSFRWMCTPYFMPFLRREITFGTFYFLLWTMNPYRTGSTGAGKNLLLLSFKSWCHLEREAITKMMDSFSNFMNALLTLSLPKADDKIFVCKFSKAILYWEFNEQRANSVDLDEVAHYKPPHKDLRCLQIQLLSSLVVKELMTG